jgi:hypothetical protein
MHSASNTFSQKIFQAESVSDAQLKVFAVEEPESADLWVCFVWDEKEITRTGLWMDMRTVKEADIIIIFVDEESQADLKVWLVDTAEESKWLNEKKSILLTLKPPPK